MNKQLVDTVFYVTGKGELQTTEKNDIENILREHPYFAPAQLLLVAKLKNENSYNIKEQTQKASLFFNNSRWFQYQLTEIKLEDSNFDYKGIEVATKDVELLSAEIPVSEIQHVETTIESQSINYQFEEIEEVEEINQTENHLSYNEIFIPNFSIPTVEHVKNIFDGIDAKENIPVVELIAPLNVEKVDEVKIEETKIVDASIEIEANGEIVEIENSKIELPNNLGIAAVKEEWDKPLDEVKDALLPFETEPYYTIDYFASQGIQFDFSKHPHDKLTTKMLKFTDWLKKMKGIKPENMDFEEDDELNKTIQHIAYNSNVSKEIVTETMAEVFAKQGKTDKAIQLYIKLSFLIPNKSSYFASKIQELKGI